jgi:hypothetical protein
MRTDGRTASNLTDEHRAFCLAEALIEIETVAINNWCSCDPDDLAVEAAEVRPPEFLSGRFSDAEVLLKRLSGTLQRKELLSNALADMKTAIDYFRAEFASESRRNKVKHVLRMGFDAGDIRNFMLEKSPFESPEWTQACKSILRFVKALSPRSASSFRVAERMHRERWQSVSRIRAKSLDIDRVRYLTSYFVPRLALRTSDLTARLPQLGQLDCNLGYGAFFADESNDARGGYTQWLKRKLAYLRDQIESAIRESSDDRIAIPSPVPHWDGDTATLWYAGRRLFELSGKAEILRLIMETFEEDGWPPKIDDPIPPKSDTIPANRVQYAVRALNSKKTLDGSPLPITFHEGDGGTTIRWEQVHPIHDSPTR